MPKNMFKVFEMMNAADIEDKGKRIIATKTLVNAQTLKKEQRFTLATDKDTVLMHDIMTGKKKAFLLIVDMEEFKKFEKL